MSLGETLVRLRTERGLSQETLAEELGVSRQSVSKWENNGAVPELDKLVRLSEIFGVTLDELVRGEKPAPEQTEPAPPPASPESPPPRNGIAGRKLAGTILLCMAFFVLVLFTALGALLGGLLFCTPFLLCGIVCFVCRKNVGLWCSWALFFSVDAYFRYGTGITWRLVRLTPIYEPSWNYARLAIAWLELFLIVLMLTVTALRLRREPWPAERRNLLRLAAGWLGFAAIHFLLARLSTAFAPLSGVTQFLYIFSDWIRWPILAALIVYTLRCFLSWRSARKNGKI